MGRADRHVPRVRRRSRQRRGLSRHRPQQERHRQRRRVRASSAATSARATAGARGCRTCRPRAQDREYTQTDLAGNDAQLAFTGTSQLAIADFVWKWAPNGNAQDTNFKLQGEYFWRREHGDLTYDATARSASRRPATTRSRPERLLRRRASSSSCRTGASACATTGSIRAASTTARTASISRNGVVQSAAHGGDARLDAVGIQPLPPAVRSRAKRGPTSPTTRSSSNTS